jgi:predicted ATPase
LAQTHFDRSIRQPTAQERQFDHLFFDDALQAALRHSALGLWLLGYPDRARARMNEALALGRNDGQPIRFAMTVFFITALHHFLRETQLAQTRAEELIALCTKYSFSQYLADGVIYSGWVLAMQGQWAVGIAQMRQALTAQMETGRRIHMSVELGLLSEACWMAGQSNEGLAALNEALAVVEQTGECFWYAELLRIKGELQSAQGAPVHEVEACYRQAVEVARQQSAKSLELRATVSLARLLQRQGKGQEARQRLAEIYDWFTEGFETPDLQDAHALLQELS